MATLSHYFTRQGPGAAVATAVDGEAPQIECFGLADLSDGTPITAETVFDLASASKIFTALAVGLLIERQRLELDTPIGELLPPLDEPTAGRPIRVRDLLQHTSGLHDYLELGMYTAADEMTPEFILQQLPAWAGSSKPGVEYAYSNTNYFVLSKVVEAVTGADFARFLESRLFDPHGLTQTFVHGGTRRPQKVARGYRNLGYGLPRIEPMEDIQLETVGDGGVFSSLNDLVRWQSLLWSGRIVSEATLRLLRTPGKLDNGQPFEYGLGLQVEERDGRLWCGHGGSWTSSTVLVGRYVRENRTSTVLSNELMAPVERIAQSG